MNGLYESTTASQPLINKQLVLGNPVQEGGVSLFRYTLFLIVPVDDICERVSLRDNASLAVTFSPADVQIRHNSAAWNLSPWDVDDLQVSVDLALPIRVNRVDSDYYAKAAFHRIDGDKVMPDAVLTVATNAAIADDFTAANFAVTLSVLRQKIHEDVVRAKESVKQMKVKSAAKKAGQQNNANAAMSANEIKAMEAALEAMYSATLGALHVAGQPSSPRMRLLSADGSESLYQWLEFAGVQTVNRGVTLTSKELQPALDRALAAYKKQREQTDQPAPPNATLVLPLHFESDAPCAVQVAAQQFAFQREANLLAGNEPVALTFDGKRQQSETLTLSGTNLAAQRVTFTFNIDVGAGVAAALPSLQAMSPCGFRLEAGDHLAVPLELQNGAFNAGHALPWWPLNGEGRLSLSLLADQGGQPATTPLASAEVAYNVENAQWLLFRWDRQTLQPGTYWLQLAVEDGEGLWLASNEAGRVHRHLVKMEPDQMQVPQIPLTVALSDEKANPAANNPSLKVSLLGQVAPLVNVADSSQWLATWTGVALSASSALAVTSSAKGVVTVKTATAAY